MVQDASQIVVGASGGVFVAPLGTTLPASISVALDAAFVDLGLATEEGVSVAPEMSTEVLRAWQSLTRVRTLITERDFTVEFMLMQWNADNIPFAFGGGVVVEDVLDAEFSYVFPDTGARDPRALAIEWQDDTKNYRLLIPNFEVTDLAAFTVARTDSANLAVTGNANTDPAAAFTMQLQTDDPAFNV